MKRILVLLALASACANEVGRDEDEPLDERDNELFQAVYDCSEHAATGYTGGHAVAIKIVTVDGRPVQTATANAYVAMQARAKSAGINLRIVSGFRTMAEQQYLYGCFVNCNCNNCNLAAAPGTSNHQSGHALDLNTSDAGVYSWLSNHARDFGFARTVPSEIWHWEWWGSASDYDGPCGAPPIPAHCASGHFNGAYCDDDGKPDEQSHDQLHDDLGVNLHCASMGGHAAFCGDADATRAHAIYALGAAAKMPLAGHPDAFVDDNGSAYERYFDAAKAYGIVNGYGGGKVKPNIVATRDTLSVILARMYLLPAAAQDYFDDDDGDANEAAHNKCAAAGLFSGFADANGGRKDFRAGATATRDTLATLALRAHDKGLVPVWDIPQTCISGAYNGAFCDDDGRGDEAAIERLVGALGVDFHCRDLAGHPAYCPTREASRADALYVLGKAAAMPVGADADGFRDDDGHAHEEYLNAAKVWGIYQGYNGGRDVKPDLIATRTTLAILLARMYALPASAQDYFTDDNGTSGEPWHNKVAAAGLFGGSDDGHGGRAFKGDDPAVRATLATLAARAHDAGLVPVWAPAVVPAPVPAGDDPAPGGTAPGTDPGNAPVVDDPPPGDLAPDPALEDGALEGAPDDVAAPVAPSVRGGTCASAGADGTAGACAVLAVSALRRSRRRRA